MINVYLIQGSTGERDDYSTWIVCAYLTRAQAEQACSELNEWCEERGVARPGGDDYSDQCKNEDYYNFKEKPTLDPKFEVDYTGTSYAVIKVPLRS